MKMFLQRSRYLFLVGCGVLAACSEVETGYFKARWTKLPMMLWRTDTGRRTKWISCPRGAQSGPTSIGGAAQPGMGIMLARPDA